jgi:ubiquinone/menaquinone biosynthesis C-methylase UbiE
MGIKEKHLQFWEDSCSLNDFQRWCGRPLKWKTDICQYIIKNDYKNILDVGCGTGSIKEILDQKNYLGNYKGTEITKKFIDLCGRKNIPVDNMNVENLKYPDNTFDCVLLLDVLSHQLDFKKPILELIRVSNKSIIIAFFKSFETPSRIVQRCENLIYHHLDQKEIKDFLDNLDVRYEFVATNFKNRPDNLYITKNKGETK